MDDMRSCKVCHVSKPLLEFQVRKSGKYLYRLHTCDVCQRDKNRIRQQEYMADHRQEHNQKVRIGLQIKYEINPEFREKAKERSQNYYWSNRDKILTQKKTRNRKTS